MTAITANGTSTWVISARLTIATSTMTRANITIQESRMPQASAVASCGFSRASFENESVTAVDETSPPVKPVRASPRRTEPARQHIADQRQARDQDHEQPELVGVECAPWVDGPVRQKRQRDESRDQQPHAGIDVVPTQLLDDCRRAPPR